MGPSIYKRIAEIMSGKVILWRADERRVDFCLPQESLSDMAESTKTPKPQAQPEMESNATPSCQNGSHSPESVIPIP